MKNLKKEIPVGKLVCVKKAVFKVEASEYTACGKCAFFYDFDREHLCNIVSGKCVGKCHTDKTNVIYVHRPDIADKLKGKRK